MKRLFLVLLFFLTPIVGALCETLVYKQIIGDEVVIHTYIIASIDSGYSIHLTRKSESQEIYEEFNLDSLFHTQRWKYCNPSKQTDISVIRRKNVILLSGTHNGERINKSYEIDSIPWAQLFPIGLENFVQSAQKKMKFYAISTMSPAEMKIAKFTAKVRNNETISCNGGTVDAIHVRISFSGLMSILWHGDCWFRKSDGRYIKWDAPGPPGYPHSLVELITE